MAKAKIIENKNENLIQKINAFLLENFNVFAFAVVLLILIAGFYAVIKPKYRTIVEVTKAKNLSNENEYNSRLEYMDMINKLKLSYEKIDTEKVEQIETFLPDEDCENELYAKIESIAAENGLYLNSLAVAGESADDKAANEKKIKEADQKVLSPELKKVKISLDLLGLNYNSFKNFLYAIENNLQLMDIGNISFSPSDGVLKLEIDTYFYKKDQKI